MNKETDKGIQEADTEVRSDDTVAKLMNLAGPRLLIPADLEERVHENVHHEWRSFISRRNRLRWAIPASLAATILIALAFNIRTPETQLQPIGNIAHVVGVPDTARAAFVVGDTVYAGDNLETSTNHGVSIALAGDISLRIAANTSLRLDQADEFTLTRGRMYIDSGERIYRDRHMTVHTAIGSATDIGTQFSVAYENKRMSVAVREGRVDVAHDQSIVTAEAGDKLTLQPGLDTVFDSVSPYDPSWNWATSLAPGFDIENQSLMDFLKWASRETGKTLVFSSDDVRMAAMGTELFGSILNFTPAEAIDSVLLTTQFRYRIDEQSITITKQVRAR